MRKLTLGFPTRSEKCQAVLGILDLGSTCSENKDPGQLCSELIGWKHTLLNFYKYGMMNVYWQ